jgi:ABC-2 type transport system ATP-binding protein
MNDDVVVSAKQLKRSFGRSDVLRGVNLEVPKGSVVGLLGTNGCGKSTLLKCLLGLLKLNSGSCSIFGEDSWNLSANARSRLGYVAQQSKFYPWMSVRQMVDYTAAYYENWQDEIAKEMLELFALSPAAKVAGLSGGEAQRLAIVLAMSFQPDLLILDEPAASLDPQGRRNLLKTLVEPLEERQRTVLFSTHITSDIERIATHVALMKFGRIEYFGELDQLKSSLKRLRITSTTTLPADFHVPKSLRLDIEGHTAVAAVTDVEESVLEQLEQDGFNVAVEDLTLEDIFLEMVNAV